MRTFRLLSALALLGFTATMLVACEEKSNVVPVGQANTLAKGNLHVRVIHPTFGAGANYLVRVYTTEADYQANRAFKSMITNSEGWAKLDGLPFGKAWVDCTVPGQPTLYAQLRNDVPLFLTDTVTLKLAPKQ